MTVRADAAAALAAREADVAAQVAADRQALRDAVVPVLQQVLATADGTPAVPLSSLTQDVADLGDRLVVVTDGSWTRRCRWRCRTSMVMGCGIPILWGWWMGAGRSCRGRLPRWLTSVKLS